MDLFPAFAPRSFPTRAAMSVAVAVAVAFSGLAGTAGTADAATPLLGVTVIGVVDELIVDHHALRPGAAVSTAAPIVEHPPERFADVDGVLLELPVEEQAEVRDGEIVSVTLSAPAGMSAEQAVAAAATPDGDEASGAPVVVVTAVAPVAPADAGQAASVYGTPSPAGAHTLTILPVYWGSPDSATRADLVQVASETAVFWSDQSGGTVTTTTTVNSWAEITDPGSCDVAALYNSAMAAHSKSAPATARDHIVVYFPARPDCGGWAGYGSVNGSKVWINGLPRTDVVAHEIGHNLGIGHANALNCRIGGMLVPLSGTCDLVEYYDAADVMGYAGPGEKPGNLNTLLADELGFLRAVDASATSVVTVDIAPLAQTLQVRALRVPRRDGSTVFVDFRPAVGRDNKITAWSGVQVHLRKPVQGYAIPASALLNLQSGAVGSSPRVAMLPGTVYSIPGSDYTVAVVSVAGSSARARVVPTAGLVPFSDVPLSHALYPEISWLVDVGVTTGYSNNTYGGTSPVTRAAMAAFLYRYAGANEPAPTEDPFTDVPKSSKFATEIAWLAGTGITTGYADNTFGVSNPVSRAAMAAFLYRLSGASAATPTTAPFRDVPVGSTFATEIAWLANMGVAAGYSDGNYYGGAAVSRQAMAAFLYRFDHPVS